MGAGARVVDSVLLPDAVVEAGASVTRSLVMGIVGRDADVVDSMIGSDGHVADGVRLHDGTAPETD